MCGGFMEKYHQLAETLQKIKRAEERLKVLIENKAELEKKVREKKIELDKENYDVEKLEGLSLEGFIHLIKGTLIDKLDKEEKEAMIAKNQYEFAVQELDVCLKEITICRDRIKDKYIIQRAYEDFIKTQEEQIVNLNIEEASQVKELLNNVYYNTEIIREIREAIEAGELLKDSILCILKSLKDAENLGVIEVLESGLLVSSSGSEIVKESNEKLVLIQQNIRKYHLELLDVLSVCDLEVDNEFLLAFSDEYLVGVIQRDQLKDKLNFAEQMLEKANEHIESHIKTLTEKRSIVKLENSILKDSKIQLIESYLDNIGGLDEKVH